MYIRKKHAENARIKRPNKKIKNYDNVFLSKYGVYLKIAIMWSLFFLIDFLMDFRIEAFWSCWLMCRSVNEIYRYQGLIYTLIFVFIVIMSDLICFLLIPTKWLFFLGCTYVWIQLIGMADRSISAFTVGSCVFYVYIEFTFRLRQVSKNLSFTLNICRPFAAHCIGYPVVTMCFELKNYVSHKFRVRRQNEVRRINQFYFELLEKAIPEEVRHYTYNAENDRISVPDSVENSSNSSTGKQDKNKILSNGRVKSNKWNVATDICDHQNSNSNSNLNISSNVTAYIDALPPPDDQHFTSSSAADVYDASSKQSVNSKQLQSHNSNSTSRSKKKNTTGAHQSTNQTTSVLNAVTNSRTNVTVKDEKQDNQLRRLKTVLSSLRKNKSDLKGQISSVQQNELQVRSECKETNTELVNIQNKLDVNQQKLNSELKNVQQLTRRLSEEKKNIGYLQSQLENNIRTTDNSTRSMGTMTAGLNLNRRPLQHSLTAHSSNSSSNHQISDCCGNETCRRQRKELELELVNVKHGIRVNEEQTVTVSEMIKNALGGVVNYNTLVRMADEHREYSLRIASLKDENLHLTEQLRELNKMKQELLTSYHSSQLEIKELGYVLQSKIYQIYDLQTKLQQSHQHQQHQQHQNSLYAYRSQQIPQASTHHYPQQHYLSMTTVAGSQMSTSPAATTAIMNSSNSPLINRSTTNQQQSQHHHQQHAAAVAAGRSNSPLYNLRYTSSSPLDDCD